MMNFKKLAVIGVVCAVAYGALADAANTLISFSSEGPDKYADGTVVLDGEWYALVWSKDGVFEGVTTACKPVDPNDAVVLVAPLATGGHCPFVVFQIDSKSADARANGVYAVYLLDTRSADRKSVAAKGADGRPDLVNAAVGQAAYAATGSSVGGSVAVSEKLSAPWAESEVVGTDVAPTIKAIVIENAKVKLTVANMLPGVKYNVKMGAAPDSLSAYALEVPKTSKDDPVFEIDKDLGNYFQVVREPLKKE